MINDILIIAGLVILGVAAIIFIPWWQVRRTIPKVIRAFRKHSALDSGSARTIDELGLRPRGLLEGAFRGRDYSQHTLNLLIQAEIVQITGDGRMFLAEAKLAESGLEKGKPFR